jgi:hypothetical protein
MTIQSRTVFYAEPEPELVPEAVYETDLVNCGASPACSANAGASRFPPDGRKAPVLRFACSPSEDQRPKTEYRR